MASYPIPPWLQPRGEDPASAYLNGYRASASVAEANARMQQQANEANTHLAVQKQQMDMEYARQQQQLAMTQAMHDAQLGIKRDQLAQAGAIAQQKMQQGAMALSMKASQMASRLDAQKRYEDMVASGVPADEAMLQLGDRLWNSAGGMAALAKGVHDRKAPPFMPSIKSFPTTSGGTVDALNVRPNAWVTVPRGTSGPGEAQPIKDAVTGETLEGVRDIGGKPFRLTSAQGMTVAKANDIITKLSNDFMFQRQLSTNEASLHLSPGQLEVLRGKKAQWNMAMQTLQKSAGQTNAPAKPAAPSNVLRYDPFSKSIIDPSTSPVPQQ